MKNCNMILTEKQKKYQLYHQIKLINMNILQVKKYYPLVKKLIEEAKFICSPLNKAFEKQMKATEDQGGRQIKAHEEHWKQLAESNAFLERNDYHTAKKLLLKENEICVKIVADINTLNNKIEYNKLMCHFTIENRAPVSFNSFSHPLGLIRKIKDCSIGLEKAKENQEKFRSNLSEITRGKWEHKSEELKNTYLITGFPKQGKKLSPCLMIILQLYVRLNMKQNLEKDTKY